VPLLLQQVLAARLPLVLLLLLLLPPRCSP
jgi:hypothetical protein